MTSDSKTLRVYSAGAVSPPLLEAVKRFEEEHGARCDTIAGKPEAHLNAIASSREGDAITCGAEYLLDEAEDQGLVVRGSRKSLGLRRSAIIVPAGNPANIQTIEDLAREGIRIGIATHGCLKGVWDDVASKAGMADSIRANITDHADACGSLMALVNTNKVDAIIGWSAFKDIWPYTSEAIEIPRDLQVFRSTPVALLSCSRYPEIVRSLIDFLAGPKCDEIYTRFGWIRKI